MIGVSSPALRTSQVTRLPRLVREILHDRVAHAIVIALDRIPASSTVAAHQVGHAQKRHLLGELGLVHVRGVEHDLLRQRCAGETHELQNAQRFATQRADAGPNRLLQPWPLYLAATHECCVANQLVDV